jgi:hypothetical protein
VNTRFVGWALRFTLIALAGLPMISSAGPSLRLETTSDLGDSVGGGRPRTYTEKSGTLFLNILQGATPGRVDFADFFLQQTPSTGQTFFLAVSTRQLGYQFKTGRYVGAERAVFAGAGKPGLDVSEDGAGCGSVTASFEITDVRFSATNELSYLDMIFEQHCNGDVPALRGRFAFDASGKAISFEPPAPVPTTTACGIAAISLLMLLATWIRLRKREADQ